MKYFKYEQNKQDDSEYPPKCSFLNQLQTINPSLTTFSKPLRNQKVENTPLEGLK